MRNSKLLLAIFFTLSLFNSTAYCAKKSSKQVGLGMGAVSAYPIASFPYALQVVLEGTYRMDIFGLSILGTATSSPQIDGTYWFGGSQGGTQQTFLEPRVYLGKLLHVGFALGVSLSEGTSGELQSVVSYGPKVGIEFPIRKVSLGIDARYLFTGSGSNPTPLSTVLMFRFYI